MQPFYLYVQTKEGIEFPFDKIEDDFIKIAKQSINTPVFVEDVKYYYQFYHGYENGKEYIYIGDVLRIPLADDGNPPKECTLTYKINGMLSKRIMDSEFLLALSRYKKIRIGEDITHEIHIDNPKEVKQLKDINTELKSVKAALDYFGVKEDLDMDRITDIDFKNINCLIMAAEHREIHFKEKDLPNLFYSNKRISNILIRILSKKK